MHTWPGMSSFGRSDLQLLIRYAPATVPAKKSSLGSKAAVEMCGISTPGDGMVECIHLKHSSADL